MLFRPFQTASFSLRSAPAVAPAADAALTRSPAQKSACKDLERDGQSRAITPEAAYTPTSNRAGSTHNFFTRSPAQKSACKDHSPKGQRPANTSEAAYTPVPNPARARTQKKIQKNNTCGA
ncbi:hypothetical protein, partial [Lacticaseibacillus rhamnosus]|uniref:hypothetical protein n=1 Tax=Lacticaseibacillus rhamnosus TaxID=47715 RepID=UPI001CDCB68C